MHVVDILVANIIRECIEPATTLGSSASTFHSCRRWFIVKASTDSCNSKLFSIGANINNIDANEPGFVTWFAFSCAVNMMLMARMLFVARVAASWCAWVLKLYIVPR